MMSRVTRSVCVCVCVSASVWVSHSAPDNLTRYVIGCDSARVRGCDPVFVNLMKLWESRLKVGRSARGRNAACVFLTHSMQVVANHESA